MDSSHLLYSSKKGHSEEALSNFMKIFTELILHVFSPRPQEKFNAVNYSIGVILTFKSLPRFHTSTRVAIVKKVENSV